MTQGSLFFNFDFLRVFKGKKEGIHTIDFSILERKEPLSLSFAICKEPYDYTSISGSISGSGSGCSTFVSINSNISSGYSIVVKISMAPSIY